MKTLLFCTIYAETREEMKRLWKWLDHHERLKYPCEVKFAAIGDGVAPDLWPLGPEDLFVNLKPHLGRPSHLNYPGWWRSFAYSATIARKHGCSRIWHVESDFFIASQRMIGRMNDLTRGWSAFWCAKHQFAETGVQVICEDKFRELEAYGSRRRQMEGRHAEGVLPLNNVFRDMVGDRYGEDGLDPREIEGLDYYGQVRPETPMFFRAAR